MAIEIVDLPSKNADCPSFFVCLPEGIYNYLYTGWNAGIIMRYLSSRAGQDNHVLV